MEAKPINIKNVDLKEGEGFKLKSTLVRSRIQSILKIAIRVIVLLVCVICCCILFVLEAATVAKTTPIFTLEELKQVEDEEANAYLANLTLILWSFAVYTLTSEIMKIMALNEKVRILESLRHRTKMESTISLIRQKSYFDADAVDFIFSNQQNRLIETVNDELEPEEMVHHRVHGMNPHRKFKSFRD
ncbi:unnamed protein product [Caenorhabditis sp. 36 PRJEB53466]|nr:unnamed protein product [Caenorhabditis sp. 36 PRJEB53466]